ncbi:glycosyltransferase family 1 protein [Jatrophihabitans sp. GAS493]|uniref:glycosyltransferase family 4 protein n=1 Tax=Jatrophihabitans sp. GAS493 TaxID=1907575 RepID=UPI000BB87BC7
MLIDATAVPANRGGVGRYVDELVPALTRLGVGTQVVCQPADAEFYAARSALAPLTAGRLAAHPAARLLWEQIELPRLVSRVRPDVLHSPHYTEPVFSRVPEVVTLHDATFFTDEALHSRVKGPFFRSATRLALRRAAGCVVPSQATADELVRVAGADPARLQVAHHGVDSQSFQPPSQQQRRAAALAVGLAPEQPYVAFLGTLEPRKNVPALIAGWSQAVASRPNPPALVLAGGVGWDETIDAAVAAVDSRLSVLRPGYIPLEHLAGFLGGAQVVSYPSLFEGFGLPVLEAMACGSAVLTSRRGPLPEVGGDAVAYCEVDAASIATELAALLDDPQRRADLGAAATARAATFSWSDCAAKHVLAYERALAAA